ncbi:hypothetical protein Plec18167_006317 [Paecilomyces lecythidis]|uniref:Uncharacterized protein n=1 Tax=Paecilomyces lecythidis TaxID=3004212 RepID=A0ABR3XCB2_9EURO
MVYQVYLNWIGNQYDGRELLVFPNRQYADEFYNRCITTNTSTNPLTDVVRYSPQFWSFHMENESRPFYFIQTNAKDLIPTVMAARISGYDNNHATGAMPIIHTDSTSNTEYKSGKSYYIRTKATPHLYWFHDTSTSHIQLDSIKRTKFQFDRQNSGSTSPTDVLLVLERKDHVRLTALSASGNTEVGVCNSHVTTSAKSFEFTFGSFYNGDLGVDWAFKSNGFVTYQVNYSGEEWEIVS